MKKELFDKKYLNKVVEIVFVDGDFAKGRLEIGSTNYGGSIGWDKKGYHIGKLGFTKSCIKSIKEV